MRGMVVKVPGMSARDRATKDGALLRAGPAGRARRRAARRTLTRWMCCITGTLDHLSLRWSSPASSGSARSSICDLRAARVLLAVLSLRRPLLHRFAAFPLRINHLGDCASKMAELSSLLWHVDNKDYQHAAAAFRRCLSPLAHSCRRGRRRRLHQRVRRQPLPTDARA